MIVNSETDLFVKSETEMFVNSKFVKSETRLLLAKQDRCVY